MVFWGVPLGRVFRSAVNYVIETLNYLMSNTTVACALQEGPTRTSGV
jgi:hypothetical protein